MLKVEISFGEARDVQKKITFLHTRLMHIKECWKVCLWQASLNERNVSDKGKHLFPDNYHAKIFEGIKSWDCPSSFFLPMQWMSGSGIIHYVSGEGRLSWMRTGRSKFKSGLWEVTLCDLSLPGHLWSFHSTVGMQSLQNKGRIVWTCSLLLGRRQVCVGKDVASMWDQHLKSLFINPRFPDKLTLPTNDWHSLLNGE